MATLCFPASCFWIVPALRWFRPMRRAGFCPEPFSDRETELGQAM